MLLEKEKQFAFGGSDARKTRLIYDFICKLIKRIIEIRNSKEIAGAKKSVGSRNRSLQRFKLTAIIVLVNRVRYTNNIIHYSH